MSSCFIKYFHVGNIGDDLLAISLILNTNYDHYYVVINETISKSGISYARKAIHSYKNVKFISTDKYRKLLKQEEDKYIANIGGSVFPENKLSYPSQASINLRAKNIVYRIGSNLSNYKDMDKALDIIKAHANTMSFFSVRDRYSENLLNLGKIYYSDPVYSLNLSDFIGGISLFKRKKVNDKKISVSFSFPNKIFNFE